MHGMRFGMKFLDVLYKLDMTIVAGIRTMSVVQLTALTRRNDMRFMYLTNRRSAYEPAVVRIMMNSLMKGSIIRPNTKLQPVVIMNRAL
jgi:hypothetical protein